MRLTILHTEIFESFNNNWNFVIELTLTPDTDSLRVHQTKQQINSNFKSFLL